MAALQSITSGDTPSGHRAAGGRFTTTRWSLVVRAGHGSDPAQSAAALQDLCKSYWPPVYGYIRHKGYSADDAQDLTQDFFAHLLEKNSMAVADPQRGKFRSFLLGAVRNFLSDAWDKSRAQKRGGGKTPCPFEIRDGESSYSIEPTHSITPEQIYERRWALTLLERVIGNLKEEFATAGKGETFALISPCLVGERTTQPYAELALQLNMTETGVKSLVHRLRGRYRTLIRQEIAQTVASPEEVDEELRYLFEVLSR